MRNRGGWRGKPGGSGASARSGGSRTCAASSRPLWSGGRKPRRDRRRVVWRWRPRDLEFYSDRRDIEGMEFITVSTSNNPAEAELVRSRLEANGFLVNLKNAEAAFSLGYGLAIGGVQVQVPQDQADSARALLESQEPPSS
jgi:hypothetical protein